jgi:hypothetical protein
MKFIMFYAVKLQDKYNVYIYASEAQLWPRVLTLYAKYGANMVC